jgi:hypothetical protein
MRVAGISRERAFPDIFEADAVAADLMGRPRSCDVSMAGARVAAARRRLRSPGRRRAPILFPGSLPDAAGAVSVRTTSLSEHRRSGRAAVESDYKPALIRKALLACVPVRVCGRLRGVVSREGKTRNRFVPRKRETPDFRSGVSG